MVRFNIGSTIGKSRPHDLSPSRAIRVRSVEMCANIMWHRVIYSLHQAGEGWARSHPSIYSQAKMLFGCLSVV
jgi:hypothetical protein